MTKLLTPMAFSPHTTTVGTLTIGANEIQVTNIAAFPTPAEGEEGSALLCTDEFRSTNPADYEGITYTGINGNKLTGVVRGVEGTAKAWSAGSNIACYMMAEHFKRLNAVIGEVGGDLSTHKSDTATKDRQVRWAILDILLRLDELEVLQFLNKTGVGFYDLFATDEFIDTANTTATLDDTDVSFGSEQVLKMKPQIFDVFNMLELALYDRNIITMETMENAVNIIEIEAAIVPESISEGDKFFYDGETYTVVDVEEM